MDNKIISQVFTTTDYDQFKFIDNNRQADHVKALTVSFKERYVPNAILCNEKMEIIDGQNRFLAAKELGLPIYYYCIQGLGIYDVASLNSYGKNWNNRDFARMWAGLGKKAYITTELINNKPLYQLSFILIQKLQGSHQGSQRTASVNVCN